MTSMVSDDEFAGMGPSFEKELNERLGNSAMAEAMKIIEHPELHDPGLRVKSTAKVFSRTYDLSDKKDREKYEKDVSMILNCDDGSLLLLDRPHKQFVQDGASYKYVAYLEWAEYSKPKKNEKRDKSLVHEKI